MFNAALLHAFDSALDSTVASEVALVAADVQELPRTAAPGLLDFSAIIKHVDQRCAVSRGCVQVRRWSSLLLRSINIDIAADLAHSSHEKEGTKISSHVM